MSIREAFYRFRELHEEYKAGAFKSPEALKYYESERDAFMQALVLAQQLTLRPGQSARQTIRITREMRLVLVIGPRREGTLTVDIGVAGFAAHVGPLAARVACDFELGMAPDVMRGKARVVASNRLADGSHRTSFSIDSMPDDDKRRLGILVMDAALERIPRR